MVVGVGDGVSSVRAAGDGVGVPVRVGVGLSDGFGVAALLEGVAGDAASVCGSAPQATVPTHRNNNVVRVTTLPDRNRRPRFPTALTRSIQNPQVHRASVSALRSRSS